MRCHRPLASVVALAIVGLAAPLARAQAVDMAFTGGVVETFGSSSYTPFPFSDRASTSTAVLAGSRSFGGSGTTSTGPVRARSSFGGSISTLRDGRIQLSVSGGGSTDRPFSVAPGDEYSANVQTSTGNIGDDLPDDGAPVTFTITGDGPIPYALATDVGGVGFARGEIAFEYADEDSFGSTDWRPLNSGTGGTLTPGLFRIQATVGANTNGSSTTSFSSTQTAGGTLTLIVPEPASAAIGLAAATLLSRRRRAAHVRSR